MSTRSRSGLQRPERHCKPWEFALEFRPNNWQKKKNIIVYDEKKSLKHDEKWTEPRETTGFENSCSNLRLPRAALCRQPLRVWITLDVQPLTGDSQVCSHEDVAVSVEVKHQCFWCVCIRLFKCLRLTKILRNFAEQDFQRILPADTVQCCLCSFDGHSDCIDTLCDHLWRCFFLWDALKSGETCKCT